MGNRIMHRFIIIALLNFAINGCIFEEQQLCHDDIPYIVDAGWECVDNEERHPDDWNFWAIAGDGDGHEDLYYLLISVTSLIDVQNTKKFVHSNHTNGYFSIERTYYNPTCGEPIDIEYIIIDFDDNSESYTVYW